MQRFTQTIKNSIFVIALFTLAFAFIGANISPENPWVLAKEEEGIKIYTRVRLGSPLKEFKGTMVVNSTISKLEKILDEVEQYPDWQTSITISNVVKSVSDSSRYVQFLSDLPWPITSREAVALMTKKKQTQSSLRYEFDGSADVIAPTEDYIRIKSTEGYWQFNLLANGKIRVTQSFFGDPAGSLPDWVINLFIVDAPLETFKNLKSLSE